MDFLRDFLLEHGPALDLAVDDTGSGTGLAGCWAQHPAAITDLTGIALAWSALLDAFDPAPPTPGQESAYIVPAPRDWLDLSNATAPARDRIRSATGTCQRAGHHVGPRRTD